MLLIDTRWIRDAIIFPTLKSLKWSSYYF
jgi:lysyl-tRNA synthetase class II